MVSTRTDTCWRPQRTTEPPQLTMTATRAYPHYQVVFQMLPPAIAVSQPFTARSSKGFTPNLPLGLPLAASFPHFLYGDKIIKTYVDGLRPDVKKHGSYVIVEPVSVSA